MPTQANAANASGLVQAALNNAAFRPITGGGGTVTVTQTGISEVQQITLNGLTSGSSMVQMKFNGATTPLANAFAYSGTGATDATAIQTALDALATVQALGAPGFVYVNYVDSTISPAPASTLLTEVFTVTFQTVNAAGNVVPVPFQQPAISATITNMSGPAGTLTEQELVRGGISFSITLNGALENANIPPIAVVPVVANTTGYAVIASSFNPFVGKVISQILIDPATGNMYVADGDYIPAADEVQTLTFNLNPGVTFTMTLTGIDATGAEVTDTTIPVLWDPNVVPLSVIAQNMQAALDALSIIGGVGGFVIVDPPPNPVSAGAFSITFEGSLSNMGMDLISTNYPLPAPGIEWILPFEVTPGGQVADAGGSAGNVGTGDAPGVYIFQQGAGTGHGLSIYQHGGDAFHHPDAVYHPRREQHERGRPHLRWDRNVDQRQHGCDNRLWAVRTRDARP